MGLDCQLEGVVNLAKVGPERDGSGLSVGWSVRGSNSGTWMVSLVGVALEGLVSERCD